MNAPDRPDPMPADPDADAKDRAITTAEVPQPVAEMPDMFQLTCMQLGLKIALLLGGPGAKFDAEKQAAVTELLVEQFQGVASIGYTEGVNRTLAVARGVRVSLNKSNRTKEAAGILAFILAAQAHARGLTLDQAKDAVTKNIRLLSAAESVRP